MNKILIFVSNGFESLELSPFIDVFGWNNILNKDKIEVHICGVHDEINATWNLKIIPQTNIEKLDLDLKEYSTLIIPGGFGKSGFFNDLENQKFKSLLAHFILNKKTIICICTGVFALAINGYLKGIRATTYLLDNNRYFNQLEKYGAISIRDEIVYSNNIITSSAPNTALKLSFYLLANLTNDENCNLVKFNMGF